MSILSQSSTQPWRKRRTAPIFLTRMTFGYLHWLLIALAAADVLAADPEWSGYLAAELRSFPYNAVERDQDYPHSFSLAFEPELYYPWDEERQRITFTPFVRLDQRDPERTHVDLRELQWLRVWDDWELAVGVGKVFWGVTEIVHLVDIINQTDLVENIDGEDKLGQPMIHATFSRDWGTFSIFVLPGFRERTFPGEDGRLRSIPRVDTDNPEYESGARYYHTDWAVRWFHTLGDYDIGISHFSGTSREPRLLPRLNDGELVLIPFYDLIDQTALDLQAIKGDWLWKLEAFTRGGQGGRFMALAGGFEYTWVGVAESAMDLGFLAEYLFDDRGEEASSFFQNDLFLGLRLVFNDVQSTEILAGVVHDLDNDSALFNVEASRRIGANWKLSVEARSFSGTQSGDPLHSFREDDHVQVELAWFW